jgi:hypothetical protein
VSSQFDFTFGGIRNARQDLQQSTFAGTISSDDSDHLSIRDLEVDVPQGPKFGFLCVRRPSLVAIAQPLPWLRKTSHEQLAETVRVLDGVAQAVTLGNIFNFNDRLHVK